MKIRKWLPELRPLAAGIFFGIFLCGLLAPVWQPAVLPRAAAQVSADGFIQLLPAPGTVISSNGTSQAIKGPGIYNAAFLALNLSAVPTGGTPTLDVYIQTSPDQGTTWRDMAHT
jgi:hypothetical protein